MTARREFTLAAAIVFGLVAAVLFPFLFGDRTLANSSIWPSLYATGTTYPNAYRARILRELDPLAGDLATEPNFALEHIDLARDGTLPLWNPYMGYGAPLAANMQAQPYSPFAWIAIGFSGARGYDWFVALRIVAAGIFAFAYLRRFTSFVPALGGGIAYLFAGYFWLYLSLPQLSVEVVAPVLLLGVEYVLRTPGVRSAIFFGVAIAFAVVGGMPEAMLLAAVFAALYAAARLLGDVELRSRWPAATRALVFGAVAGAGLSAVATIPFLEYLAGSYTAHGGPDPQIGLGFGDPFSIRALALYVAPLLFGGPITPTGIGTGILVTRGFFGAVAAFLALLAIASASLDFCRGRREASPVFFFSAIGSVLLMERFDVPAVRWIQFLPGLRLIIFVKYEEAIIACCIAALVAFGIARLCERRVFTPAIAIAFIVPFATLLIGSRGPLPPPGVNGAGLHETALWESLVFLVCAAGAATLATNGRARYASIAGVTVVVLLALELPVTFLVPEYYFINPLPPQAQQISKGAPYLEFLHTHLHSGERFFGEQKLLQPGWSAAFEIPDVRALDAIYCARYLPFVRAFVPAVDFLDLKYFFVGRLPLDVSTELGRRFLELSSVRYLGSGASDTTLARPRLRSVFSSPGAHLYEFSSPLPRIAVYRHVLRASDGPDALRLLTDPRTDPREEAVVEGDESGLAQLAVGPHVPVGAGRFERYASQEVRISVSAPSLALLVLNDTNFTGWSATIDGRPAAIVPANYLFRGVVVGPGTHAVVFRYRPVSFALGAALSITALVTMAATPFVTFRRNRRARESDMQRARA